MKARTGFHFIELALNSIGGHSQGGLVCCKLKAVAAILREFDRDILGARVLGQLTDVLQG